MYRCRILFFLLTILVSFLVSGQDQALIQGPFLSLHDSVLRIGYDLLNTSSYDRYTIRVEISHENKLLLDAPTLTGHVGGGIKGGKNRQILWSYQRDLPGLTEPLDIDVRLFASRESNAEHVSAGKIMGRSLLFPGWGLSTLKSNKPYWLLGAAAYASLASSVTLGQLSNTYYGRYKDEMSPELRDSYYQTQENLGTASTVLAISAAGIWVTNLAWTYLNMKKIFNQQNVEMSFCFPRHPFRQIPIPEVMLVYKF